MASIAGTGISVSVMQPFCHQEKVINGGPGPKMVFFSRHNKNFPGLRLQRGLRFHVSCAAKVETVEKVCEIVKTQLALPEGTSVTAESTFTGLGADSLDTVEIVMGLEEAFGITVQEDAAQTITSIQDAADLIDDLVQAKSS